MLYDCTLMEKKMKKKKLSKDKCKRQGGWNFMQYEYNQT